ncbi:MAG: hypothetical protein GVY32_07630 [Gammaproteobacteria bacterium]|jgi:predicted Ser/Thr protein kinase|nr:hypothetical protein [Gammaproteobacteria bacterium]
MAQAESRTERLESLFADFNPADWPLVADSNQGTIVRVQAPGLDLAVKSPRGRGIAREARRLSLRREFQAYRRIAGLAGFPRCLGLFGGCHLALEYLEGDLLRHAIPPDRPRFFDELRQIIVAMHGRGVAHGDLKSRKNVLVASDGRPAIIDLGAAVVRRPGWRPLNHWLFGYLRQIDLNGWVKLKYGSYDRVDELDRHLVRRSRIERVNHWARRRGL